MDRMVQSRFNEEPITYGQAIVTYKNLYDEDDAVPNAVEEQNEVEDNRHREAPSIPIARKKKVFTENTVKSKEFATL